jgi:nucleoside-diphosphate-sugar epimerase
MMSIETRVRPDTFYGVGKAAAEALHSLYHDCHGFAVACRRIGSFRGRPTTRRELYVIDREAHDEEVRQPAILDNTRRQSRGL